jgi:hypothetical protein
MVMRNKKYPKHSGFLYELERFCWFMGFAYSLIFVVFVLLIFSF